MTLAEFLSWQSYAKAKAREANTPRPTPPDELPELGAMGPAGVAMALRGR